MIWTHWRLPCRVCCHRWRLGQWQCHCRALGGGGWAYPARSEEESSPPENDSQYYEFNVPTYMCKNNNIPYTWKFSLDKNFAKPSYLCIAEIFYGCQCGKGCHILYVIIKTGQKIHMIKISPMQADGEIGKIFYGKNFHVYCNIVESPHWISLGQCFD